MLNTLIAKLTKSLLRPKFNPGYQTWVYPRLGEMVIVHDSLDFGPIATADELKLIDDFWLSNEMPITGLLTHNYCEDVFAFDSLPGINPASELPMMDGLLDVAGNLYRMSHFHCESDFTHTSFGTGTFI